MRTYLENQKWNWTEHETWNLERIGNGKLLWHIDIWKTNTFPENSRSKVWESIEFETFINYFFFFHFIFLSSRWQCSIVASLFRFSVLSTSNRKLALQGSHRLESKQSSSRFSLIIVYSEPSFVVGSKHN